MGSSAGSFLLVGGFVGYGPHNNNPKVLFIGQSGVHSTAAANSRSAWLRQQRRA
ncbi:hypothetical protein ACWDBW_16680 [Streptomyces sp. NPDC001107]